MIRKPKLRSGRRSAGHSKGGSVFLHCGHSILIFIHAIRQELWYRWLQGGLITRYLISVPTGASSGPSTAKLVRQIAHSWASSFS